MTYYADLTRFQYRTMEPENWLNVGWLSKDHDFPTGDVPPDFLEALRAKCNAPVNLYRGSHGCEFCAERLDVRNGVRYVIAERNGNGEIHVPGNGLVYVAPVLIRHYVEVHKYLPPAEFIAALVQPVADGEQHG